MTKLRPQNTDIALIMRKAKPKKIMSAKDSPIINLAYGFMKAALHKNNWLTEMLVMLGLFILVQYICSDAKQSN